MMKRKIRFAAAVLMAVCAVSITAQAGGINAAESSVISAASGTFEYKGKTYVAKPEYLSQVTAKLSEDGVDPVSYTHLVEYRDQLRERQKARTVNVKLSAINAYLTFSRMTEYKVKFLRHQRKAFVEDNRELTKEEYRRLLKAAKSLSLIHI